VDGVDGVGGLSTPPLQSQPLPGTTQPELDCRGCELDLSASVDSAGAVGSAGAGAGAGAGDGAGAGAGTRGKLSTTRPGSSGGANSAHRQAVRILSADESGYVRVWCGSKRTVLHSLFWRPLALINWVRYAGDVIVCAGRDCEVRMWDVRRQCGNDDGNNAGVNSGAGGSAGGGVVAGGFVAESKGTRPFRTLRRHTGEIISLCVGEDYFVTGSSDRSVCLYNF
jgi:WD40 repeat protein